jgi:hypothetical protein
MINLDGFVPALMIGGGLIVAAVWGFIDWMWIDDAVRVSEPLVPTIELVIDENNAVDTVYVYQIP